MPDKAATTTNDIEVLFGHVGKCNISIPMIQRHGLEQYGVYRSGVAIAHDRDNGHLKMIRLGNRYFTTTGERDRYLRWLVKCRDERTDIRREKLARLVRKSDESAAA